MLHILSNYCVLGNKKMIKYGEKKIWNMCQRKSDVLIKSSRVTSGLFLYEELLVLEQWPPSPTAKSDAKKEKTHLLYKILVLTKMEAGLTLFLWDGGAGSFAMTWAESQKSNIDFPVVNLAELNLAVIR